MAQSDSSAVASRAASRQSGPGGRMFHVKQASAPAPALDRPTGCSPARSCRAAAALAALTMKVCHEQRQCRRRNSIEPAGVADRTWPLRLQFVPYLVGETWQRRVVEVFRQNEALVA